MKQKLLIALVAIFVLAGISSTAQNQQGQTKPCCPQGQQMHPGGGCGIPNLTDEQLKKMEPLRLDFQKKSMEIKNQIKVKEAQLVTVTTGDKINKDEAYKIIDEISVLKANLQKAKLDHRLAVRAILTPEQQLAFDMHGMKGGKKHGQGHMGSGKGQGCGMGNGQGCGMGQMQGNCGGQKSGGCSGNGGQHGQGNCSQGK